MTMVRMIVLAAAVGLGLAGCGSGNGGGRGVDAGVPLFEGLGGHGRAVTTRSAAAQRYFDQGLAFTYAFNHDEAIRSYEEARRLDPECAMAWWGVALCHGPHINNPMMTPERSAAAWAALEKARAAGGASATERDLITALSARYANPAPGDRAPLDKAYAEAMRGVWQSYQNDADIGCLFAESMMDLRPWDLWTQAGEAQPGTEEIVSTLEEVMRLNPRHPGANHLYIHAVEASPRPERAVAAADRLRDLAPGLGHLVHMPAHIDVRTGQWTRAAEANERAMAADKAYRQRSPNQGFYRLYMAHNEHFLAYTAMMQGRRAAAKEAVRGMMAGVPAEFLKTSGAILDPYTPIGVEVLIRFGLWDELLREPEPPKELPITRVFWRFGRGVAHAAKGNIAEARAEQEKFRAAAAALPEGAMMAINPAKDVLGIAELMLEGEIAYREGRIDEAVSSLREAVSIEDKLRYMEPPDWVQPVRHPLGAILLSAGRAAEAEQVYREDLAKWPENGWSLFGLAKALRAQGDPRAEEVEVRFRRAWARADTPLTASCLCVKAGG